jgi:small subunit ribosomal protein S8
MMTDTIADLLTRIRNANAARAGHVDIPASGMKMAIAEILKKEGYINDFRQIDDTKQGIIRIELKYSSRDESVIHHIQRVSRPSRRVYVKASAVESACNGLGVSILSTSQGVMTDKEAKRRNIGGEVLCEIW